MESRSVSFTTAKLASIASVNAEAFGPKGSDPGGADATVDAAPRSNYPCPHCRIELEFPPDDGWTGWRLCPICARPSLPPERNRAPEAPWLAHSQIRAGVLSDGVISGLPAVDPTRIYRAPGSSYGPVDAELVARFEPFGDDWRASRTLLYRRVVTACLGLSLFATLVTFLEQSNVGVGISCLVSLLMFLLLMRPERRY